MDAIAFADNMEERHGREYALESVTDDMRKWAFMKGSNVYRYFKRAKEHLEKKGA
ncbi:hypothetical protein FGF1_03940 [Flavobacteriaceae bacterium GF1]